MTYERNDAGPFRNDIGERGDIPISGLIDGAELGPLHIVR
jgi:hypothetical protein